MFDNAGRDLWVMHWVYNKPCVSKFTGCFATSYTLGAGTATMQASDIEITLDISEAK